MLNVEQHQLFSIDTCSQDEANTFFECINKRIGGVPYAYIVGKQEFMKLKFKVTSDVLIPRADTEVLVEYVIKLANENLTQEFYKLSEKLYSQVNQNGAEANGENTENAETAQNSGDNVYDAEYNVQEEETPKDDKK